MQLNQILEKFYLAILDYAGLELKDNCIENKDEKLGPITIDNRKLTLPYLENLKNPDNKLIFHLLNENYINPENTIFNLYKKRLILELNLKLSSLIINLITIASDVQLQSKIKSSELTELISNIGIVDYSLIDSFLSFIKASKKVNEEAFILDIFLKKNGEINNVPYSAIGKINFLMYKENLSAFNDKEYKVYGYKLRKKDLIALDNIFKIIFPNIDSPDYYTEGTDNKVFRYLNILLKTSYQVSNRVNYLVNLLNEVNNPDLNLEYCKFNLEWVEYLEKTYELTDIIRLIPNQVDITIESNKLKVDESKVNTVVPNTQLNTSNTQSNIPQFNPSLTQTSLQTQPTQTQPTQPLSPEDIIKGSMSNSNFINPMIPQNPMMYQNPMIPQNPMMYQNQTYTPSWIIQEQMKSNFQQQPILQQQVMPMGIMQQPTINGIIQQPIVNQQSTLFNPHFLNKY